MFNIGARIKELRLQLNLTQAELARRIGKRQESINRMEKGKYNPSYEVLNDICEALGISLSEFFSTEVNNLPSDLIRLIDTAKKLSPEERQKLNEFLETMKKNN